jgi:hypothetical protein
LPTIVTPSTSHKRNILAVRIALKKKQRNQQKKRRKRKNK